MKYSVCYIDGQAAAVTLEAASARRAAWNFLARFPRGDTSQITVELVSPGPWRGTQITHYRACDLAGTPAPEEVEEPGEIGFEIESIRETYITVSGSRETLRAMCRGILKGLDEAPGPADAVSSKGRDVYGVRVLPGDGSRRETFLSFKVDEDVTRFWSRRFSAKGMVDGIWALPCIAGAAGGGGRGGVRAGVDAFLGKRGFRARGHQQSPLRKGGASGIENLPFTKCRPTNTTAKNAERISMPTSR